MKFVKTALLIVFIQSLSTLETFAKQNNYCNYSLFDNVEQLIALPANTQTNDVQIKDLTNEELKSIRDKLCMNIITAESLGFKHSEFRKVILNGLGLTEDVSNANEVISTFLNKYKQELVCPRNKNDVTSRDLHIYKLAVNGWVVELLDELLDEDIYDIDFNAYEIVDGKKETLVDYIQKLMDSGQYDYEDMELLRDDIIDAGGKRGSEL